MFHNCPGSALDKIEAMWRIRRLLDRHEQDRVFGCGVGLRWCGQKGSCHKVAVPDTGLRACWELATPCFQAVLLVWMATNGKRLNGAD